MSVVDLDTDLYGEDSAGRSAQVTMLLFVGCLTSKQHARVKQPINNNSFAQSF